LYRVVCWIWHIKHHSFTSNRARFLARKAEACYGAGQIGECIDVAQEAFAMASPLNQKNTIERVSALQSVLSQSRWSKEQGAEAIRYIACSILSRAIAEYAAF
jgi:hypothetical protein